MAAVEAQLVLQRLVPATVNITQLESFARPAGHYPNEHFVCCQVHFDYNATPVYTRLSSDWQGFFPEYANENHVPHCIELMLRDAQGALASQPPRDTAPYSR